MTFSSSFFSAMILSASLTTIVWSVYKTHTPVHGIVFDYDVIEQTGKTFVGLHKVLFNSTDNNLPMSCIYVIARGTNREDVLQRTVLPGPVDQQIVVGKTFGMCEPFQPWWNGALAQVRFVCVIVICAIVFLEYLTFEYEHERKKVVLPLRKSDSNFTLHVSSTTDDGVQKEV